MPEGERIISIGDRVFGGSLGNWIGDAVYWEMGGVGYARFNFNFGYWEKEMTLAYPDVLIELNGTFTLRFGFFQWMRDFEYTATATVSDENYSFQKIFHHPENPVELNFDTPTDWDRKKGYAKVQVIANITDPEEPPPLEIASFFWNFSLWGSWSPIHKPSRVQYLPIMGIG
jgi:hypothetical protein